MTIREKEAAEKREEQMEAERKRQEELRKRESQRVSRLVLMWSSANDTCIGNVLGRSSVYMRNYRVIPFHCSYNTML